MPPSLKIPPHNLEAEQSVLGALMIDKEAIIQVADILNFQDFYKPSHGKIYETILALFEKNQPIDILSISSRLKEAGIFNEIGGTNYLTELVNAVPSASHVIHYATLVREKKILRDLINASSEIGEMAFNPNDDDIDHLLDTAEQKIFSIAQKTQKQRFANVSAELASAYERIENIHRNPGALRGVTTGFPELDNYLSGLQPSDLVILGARPSMGKTSFALDIARNAALNESRSVCIFSLEMATDQVIDRLIAADARVSLWHLRSGRLKNEVDFQLIQAALDNLSKTKIFIDDTAGATLLQIRSAARRLQAEHGLDLIVIDYLQLITPRMKSENIVAQVTEISRGLKILARELNVPVIALSQLSRGVEQRDNKVPRLSDLRESGSIEQDADVVMLIYRKDKDKQSPEIEEINSAEIIVAKHRNGPTGSVRLKFDPERASFDTLDKYHTPPTTI